MLSRWTTTLLRQGALLGALGLAVGCTSENPAYQESDGSPGGGGGALPEVLAPADAAEVAPAPPDLAAEPDAVAPPDVPAMPDLATPPDAPAMPDVATSPDVGLPESSAPEVGPPEAPPPVYSCAAPATGTGTGLRAEYFSKPDFTGTKLARNEAIDGNWGDGRPDPAIGDNDFSVRWTGQVQAMVSGPHTFVAVYNDGMRMFLDDRVVLYRWGPRLSNAEDRATVMLEGGRKYDLRFEFFEQGGAAAARLLWENGCQSRQVVPRAQLYGGAFAASVCPAERPPASGTGLKVEYFTSEPGVGSVLASGVGQRIDFDWGTGAPAAGVPSDFATRWTGSFESPIDGPITLYFAADDVGRVRVAGKQIADSMFEPFGPQEIAATIDVRAGQRYDLLVEHRDLSGSAFARLLWSWNCHPREVVPTNRLYAP